MFDTYLSKQLDYGPQREAQWRSRENTGRIGYSRDPALQMPALQVLLSTYGGVVDAHGEVEREGLHYAAEIMALFPHKPVVLRPSLIRAGARHLFRRWNAALSAKSEA